MAVRVRLAGCAIGVLCALAGAALPVMPASGASRRAPQPRKGLPLGTEAYLYGLPVLAERGVVSRLPINRFVDIGAPASPATRLVVLPNADTPYSTSRLDLRSGPVVLEVPDTAGRYYTMQFLDAYTNVFAYVGKRVTGTRAGRYAIVGPGWHGRLPRGLPRIDSPTPDAWLLGRLLPRDPADLSAIRRLQQQFVLTPLSAYEAGGPPAPPLVLPSAPAVVAPPMPSGLAFFDQLDQILQTDPPPARDRQLLRRLTRVGIGPGRQPSSEHLSNAVRTGLEQASAGGRRQLQSSLQAMTRTSARRHNGWLVFPSAVGRFGRDYLLRALVAREALGANLPAEATYPLAFSDHRGRPLNGRHSYTVHFAAHELPPVAAFWSLTVYRPDLFLSPNSIGRYSIGDHTPGLRRNRDGSLDLRLRQSVPRQGIRNWLPIPRGRFVLALRLFAPRRSAVSGRWPLPTVSVVGSP